MKNVAATILLIAVFSSTVQAQQADSLEYALSFYPLHIDNQWDYYYQGGSGPPPTKYYIKVQVVSDTLIHDTTYMILNHRRWVEESWIDPGVWKLNFEYFTYERIDSSTGNVYAWADHFEEPTEVLNDSLLAFNQWDNFKGFRYRYREYHDLETMRQEQGPVNLSLISEKEILGMQVETRNYEPQSHLASEYHLTRNIGITGFSLGGEAFTEIVYARINGEEFGERIFTNLEETESRPVAINLQPNYPNPFNPSTTLRYDLDQAGPVRLEVYDLSGRRVALLSDGPAPAGSHSVEFNADGLASGFYIARLTAANSVQHRKMLLVK